MDKKLKESNVQAVYRDVLHRFGGWENVTAIDIGHKYKQGEEQPELAVRIHVTRKIPASALESVDLFPESIGGVLLDVIEASYEPQSQNIPGALSDRWRRSDPMMPGISIGHKNITAGTLGLFVRDNVTKSLGILNEHEFFVIKSYRSSSLSNLLLVGVVSLPPLVALFSNPRSRRV